MVGDKLRMLRLSKHMTMQEAAMRLGVSQSAIAMYESDRRVPRDEIKIKIALLYGQSVGKIFFND